LNWPLKSAVNGLYTNSPFHVHPNEKYVKMGRDVNKLLIKRTLQ